MYKSEPWNMRNIVGAMTGLILPDYSDIANSIRESRRELSISQGELADRVGTTRATISRIENEDIDARYDTLYRILDELNRARRSNLMHYASEPVVWAQPDDSHREMASRMRSAGYSQLPVRYDGEIYCITDRILATNGDVTATADELVEPGLIRVVDADTDQAPIALLEESESDIQALLIETGEGVRGIITYADLI